MQTLCSLVLTFLVFVTSCYGVDVVKSSVNTSAEGHHETADHDAHESHGVHLASWRWDEFSSPILFTGMIISAVILKIIFHHLPRLEKLLPESCVLIVVGILCGLFIDNVLLHHSEDNRFSAFPKFTANLFFNILLPPIIFDSALSLYNKEFLAEFASVVIFAVFGTLFNVFAVGYSLYGLSSSGIIGTFETVNTTTGLSVEHQLQPIECLIFSSLISAVDPVAVLAIFEQIHVNMGLYFLVFGESLFNDGVTVVLYNTFIALMGMNTIGAMEIFMAVLSFFTVVFGGAFIGCFHGLFVSLITRFTKHVRVVEPLILFSTAYSAFLFAEVFHWSGIISIIGYGITTKRFAFQNISQKSYTTVKYSTKTLASTSDCIIFLFLGLELIEEKHYPHPGFIVATILLCLFFRFISTFLFSSLVNLGRLDKITLKEQFIMAYGGLRGAVGFSLAVVLRHDVWYRDLFVTTALVMVFFTVFLQGGTIGLLVKLLDIELNKKTDAKICPDIQAKVMEDVTEGIVAVCGKNKAKGAVMQRISVLDKKLKSLLTHDDSKTQLQRKFERIALDEHYTNLYAPRLIAEKTEHETNSPGVPEESLKKTKKMLQKGLNSSDWEKYRSHAIMHGNHRDRDVLDQLELKRERTHSMGVKILEDNLKTEKKIKSAPITDIEAQPSWKKLVHASSSARLLKAQYDDVQSRSKHHTIQENQEEDLKALLKE